jgi:hypothetical protein
MRFILVGLVALGVLALAPMKANAGVYVRAPYVNLNIARPYAYPYYRPYRYGYRPYYRGYWGRPYYNRRWRRWRRW